MNKEQQIEEIAKIQCDSCKKYSGEPEPESCDIAVCLSLRKKYAEALYNAGYRKIPDGGCVLNKEENQNFIKFVMEQKKKTRKATAQEFAEKLKKCTRCDNFFTDGKWHRYIFIDDIDELLKDYEE